MTSSSRFLVVGIILSAIMTTFSEALQENDCPVCFSIVKKLREDLKKSSTPPTEENYSTAFLHLCDTATNDSAESKFCYYMGGQDVSATRTYREMSNRLAAGLPDDKVCELLRSRDSQICEIKEKKPIDLNTVDLKKLKVADLKRILKERGESCDGCFEKAEFIKRVEAIKAREEL